MQSATKGGENEMNLFQFRPLSEQAGGEPGGARAAVRVQRRAVNLATPAGREAFATALTRGARGRRTTRRAR